MRRRSRVHHLAAINVDRLSGDVARVIRGEKNGHRCKFRRCLPAAERRLPAQPRPANRAPALDIVRADGV